MSRNRKRTFAARAISEIPELSHGILDRRPRHSEHPSLLAMPAVFSAFSITLVGRFPELTPVRSQTIEPWFATLEAGDRLSPLTEAECAELMAKRACFRCRKPGHMSRDCYNRRGPEVVNVGNTAPAPEPLRRETGPQKPTIESIGGIEGMYDLLSNRTEAEKEAFIDKCQGF